MSASTTAPLTTTDRPALSCPNCDGVNGTPPAGAITTTYADDRPNARLQYVTRGTCERCGRELRRTVGVGFDRLEVVGQVQVETQSVPE